LGLRTHLRVCWPGVIFDHRLVAANIHDVTMAVNMLDDVQGYLLADRNYWSPDTIEQVRMQGLHWLVPYKSSKQEKQPFPIHLKHKRYRIETIIGQFVERFTVKKIWARDAWHLISRWLPRLSVIQFHFFFVKKRGYLRFNFPV
jgi:hypothetical protein